MKWMVRAFLGCAAAVFLWAAAAGAASAPADGLALDRTSKAVVFNHSAHRTLDCKECHHAWDGAGAIQRCYDAGCHDAFDKADKSVKSYYLAVHNKKAKRSTCVSCHEAEAARLGKEAGGRLKGCTRSVCHP